MTVPGQWWRDLMTDTLIAFVVVFALLLVGTVAFVILDKPGQSYSVIEPPEERAR